MKLPFPSLIAAALALGGLMSPVYAAPSEAALATHQSRNGLHDVSDPELNALRGRYTVGSNAVAWFGVKMISTWQTSAGQTLQGTMAVSMNFRGQQSVPQITFQPSVSITSANAVVPMPVTGRSVDGSGLANVSGVVQSVQVAGDGNLANNVVRMNVSDGGTASTIASADSTQAVTTTTQDGASASATFDGKNAGVQLNVAGVGSVQQWIRNGSLGQTVQLAADNQSVSNVMQIDLIRQSLAMNTQLSQSVAQAINLTRGIGGN